MDEVVPESLRALDAEIDAGSITKFSTKPMEMVDLETKVAGEVLNPGIKPYIQKLFDQSSCSAERGRALELLTALALGEEIQPGGRSTQPYHHPKERRILRQRPKTAMAMLESKNDATHNSCFNAYETSYNSHFPIRPTTATKAERPSTAVNSFIPHHTLSGAVGTTTYGEEFRSKHSRKSEPIRAGTSSGNRNNNPHPNKEFMVWRYPRSSASNASSDASKENMDLEMQMAVTGEEFDRVIRGKCRSTYQSDFTGLPQGADVSARFADLPDDPMARIRYSKESTNRTIHGPPPTLPSELRVPTTRFGAKRDRLPAYGTLPGVVSTTQMQLKSRTTYDRDLNDRATTLYGQMNDIRRMGRHYTEDAVKKCMTMTAGKEREDMQRMLDGIRQTSADSLQGRRIRSSVAGGVVDGRVTTPSWVSRWAGPT